MLKGAAAQLLNCAAAPFSILALDWTPCISLIKWLSVLFSQNLFYLLSSLSMCVQIFRSIDSAFLRTVSQSLLNNLPKW